MFQRMHPLMRHFPSQSALLMFILVSSCGCFLFLALPFYDKYQIFLLLITWRASIIPFKSQLPIEIIFSTPLKLYINTSAEFDTHSHVYAAVVVFQQQSIVWDQFIYNSNELMYLISSAWNDSIPWCSEVCAPFVMQDAMASLTMVEMGLFL